MTKQPKQEKTYIQISLDELETAKSSGDEKQIVLAHARLGSAYLFDRDLKHSRENFAAGDELVEKLADESVEVEYLKIKSFAQQAAGHLADAYRGAERIYEIGKRTGDLALMSDALASQGQIQLDSADPVTASEKLQQALDIAKEIDDKRRMMSVYGALGNLSMAIGATDRALKEFYQARSLAAELEDEKSEIGFSGNIGTILAFQGNHSRAVEEFDRVLAYVETQGDLNAQISALRHLCQSHGKLNNHEAVLDYARRGAELGARKDNETVLFFIEKIIITNYHLKELDRAQEATQEAIEIASRLKDKAKQVELLISLGESFTFSEAYPQALEIYRHARDGARRLQQLKNEAYLVGRIGVVLAEMGELDEAIAHHQEAVSLAQDRKIADLEGEQLSMLAMAYRDKDEIKIALEYAEQALQVFLDADLLEESEAARRLLAQIKEG